MSTPYLPPNLPPNRRIMPPTPRKLRWPDLAIDQILGWADAHHARVGGWPTRESGPVEGAPREKWHNIDMALRHGFRGLQKGSSLARLLDTHRGVRNRKALAPYTEARILGWADAHHERTGLWPTRERGPIQDAPGETWTAVEMALAHGQRGLPGGSSLIRLLAAHRGVINRRDISLLTEGAILGWADAHHERTGQWPTAASGAVIDAPGKSWSAIDRALRNGRRGLPGGSSLLRLLERERGVPNRLHQPDLTDGELLAWADGHHARTGRWPVIASGAIVEAPNETWASVHHCLRQGCRGLQGGRSLPIFLAEHRGATRQGKAIRVLPVAQILAWADAHHARTGRWPSKNSGSVDEAPGETWTGIDVALSHGHRGLPGGSSLAQLLARHRGVPERMNRPLTDERVLTWADAYHEQTGRWPSIGSGAIAGAAGDTWNAVDRALRSGHRGLPGSSSLCRLLAARRGVLNEKDRPPLSVAQILTWADAHQARTGRWPTKHAGDVEAAPGENWASINNALIQGSRGLPGGSSLPRLLDEQRGVPNLKNRPPLTIATILAWADAHYARHGRWPRIHADRVEDAPHETWSAVQSALQQGTRGLPGGMTLYRLLAEHRGVQDWRSRRR